MEKEGKRNIRLSCFFLEIFESDPKKNNSSLTMQDA